MDDTMEKPAMVLSVTGYARRRSKALLIAFNRACDDNKPEAAERFLSALDALIGDNTFRSVDRHELVSALIDGHERLWNLKHSAAALTVKHDTIH
jgi:hypothetical protein